MVSLPSMDKVLIVLTREGKAGLVASTATGHSANQIARGASTLRLRDRARSVGRGVLIRGLAAAPGWSTG